MTHAMTTPLRIKYTVRTLDERALQTAAHALCTKVQADYRPNIVVGIRTGGFTVAELMMEALPTEAILLPITCRRPSTRKKQKFKPLRDVLTLLPQAVNDRLRVLEHHMLTSRQAPQTRQSYVPDAHECAQIAHLVRLRGETARILVVDDAVDSGATLATVVDTLRATMHTQAVLRTAVITVTTINPFVCPDYHVFRHVLCRFPWSFDFKSTPGDDLRSRRYAARG